LRAAGGELRIVATLRALMQKELPAQRARVEMALAHDDAAAAAAELHRLRASCGFCGAKVLAQAVEDLHAALHSVPARTRALAAFRAAVDQLLASSSD
jgi:HPt (histidine-containing phosphotransfer) domain-containing protein